MHRLDPWVSADDREPPVDLWGVKLASARPWWSRLLHRRAPDVVVRVTVVRFTTRPEQDLGLAALQAPEYMAGNTCRWCMESSPSRYFGFGSRTEG